MDVIKCPLCCNKVYPNHHELIKHLMNVLENINCPLCHTKASSVSSLIEHLSLNNCQNEISTESLIFTDSSNFNEIANNDSKLSCLDSQNEELELESMVQSADVKKEMGKMYVELYKKESLPSSIQENQELRLEEEGEDQIFLMTNEDSSTTQTVLFSKQNSDGTISLFTENVKTQLKTVTQEKEDQTYSCNSCGVTFTSVLEHIQNYHNDQDVVVEDNTYETISDSTVENPDWAIEKEEEKVVTIENNIEENAMAIDVGPTSEAKNGYCHKVVIKEMQGLENGNKVKVFNCISCNVYVAHLSDFRNQPCKAKHPCPLCPVSYDNPKSLSAHMKIHKTTAKQTASFKCELCCTEFSTNKSLKLHKRMHDPIKSRPLEPPVQSAKIKVPSLESFLCDVCDKVIPLDYRAVHEKSHSGDQPYNCDVCNRKFTSFEFMEMHMRLHKIEKVASNKQDKTLLYSCSYCPRQFARPHEKVKHERIHTGEKPHSCDICGKSFRVSYCLTLHMRTHTGARPYECNHCGKKFKAHSVYNHHLLTHSDVRAYKCPFCPKAFKTSVQLAGHKNSHTKPFSCQYCNRPFASLYAVRVHTETHQRQNNLKFSCELCGATYARTFALRDHLRQAHRHHSADDPKILNVKNEDTSNAEVTQEDIALKELLVEEQSDK